MQARHEPEPNRSGRPHSPGSARQPIFDLLGATKLWGLLRGRHPRGDFLDGALIDTGAFDYAADAWGYSYGSTLEWYVGDWTLRGGGFSMSKVPNGENLESNFSQYQLVGELERRYGLAGRKGSCASPPTGAAPASATSPTPCAKGGGATDAAPDLALVRRYRGHAGASLDWEQPVTDDAGVFARAGYADGHQQAFEFTDVDRTTAFGLSLQGRRWGRQDDTVGVAGGQRHQRGLPHLPLRLAVLASWSATASRRITRPSVSWRPITASGPRATPM